MPSRRSSAAIDSRLRVEEKASVFPSNVHSKCLPILRRRSVPRRRLNSSRSYLPAA